MWAGSRTVRGLLLPYGIPDGPCEWYGGVRELAGARRPVSWWSVRSEVVARLQVRDQGGVFRLPAQQLAGEGGRGAHVDRGEAAEPAEVVRRVLGGHLRDRHVEPP